MGIVSFARFHCCVEHAGDSLYETRTKYLGPASGVKTILE